jgi:hypothetical protein
MKRKFMAIRIMKKKHGEINYILLNEKWWQKKLYSKFFKKKPKKSDDK